MSSHRTRALDLSQPSIQHARRDASVERSLGRADGVEGGRVLPVSYAGSVHFMINALLELSAFKFAPSYRSLVLATPVTAGTWQLGPPRRMLFEYAK